MEYGTEISIFGIKLMMKSGLEKIFEIPPCASCFLINEIYYIEKHSVTKSVMKRTFFAHGGISILFF